MGRPSHLMAMVAASCAVLAPVTGLRSAGPPAPVAQLAAVRVGAHPTFDRLVLQFAGALPQRRSVTWVPQVVQDASGKVLHIAGRVYLRVVVQPASAHTAKGAPTWAGTVPARLDLPVLASVKLAGDFENVLSFGVGLWQKVPLHVFTLSGPPRLVIDATVPPSGPNRLDEADAGRLAYLRVGQKVTVALRTCTSCGYSWHASALPDPVVMGAAGPVTVPLPHPSGVVGFPYETRWVLTAVAPGRTELRLYEKGPQPGAAPVARYTVRFLVR